MLGSGCMGYVEWFHYNLSSHSQAPAQLSVVQGPGNETRTYTSMVVNVVVFSGKEWRVQATGGLWDLQPFTGTTWWPNHYDVRMTSSWDVMMAQHIASCDYVMMTSYSLHQTSHDIIRQGLFIDNIYPYFIYGLLDMQPLHAQQIAS